MSTLQMKQFKLPPTVIVLCSRNLPYTKVCAKPFYMHKNQCKQILKLSSPGRVR